LPQYLKNPLLQQLIKLRLARQTWKRQNTDEKAAALDYRRVKRIAVI
jgi:hypothetical protein